MNKKNKMRRHVLLVIFVVLFSTSRVLAEPIPDTGQIGDYTATFGEDSDYDINTQSYTQLDASGNDMPFSASYSTTPWAMVRDNVTGLIWEVKTDDDTIQDRDNQYNWQNAQDVFIFDLNANSFGGYNDWRMPTVKELSSLINSNTYNPTIDQNYFPNTVASYYWSSTTCVEYTSFSWSVDLDDGYVYGHSKSNSHYVRAVRGGQFSNNFTDNGDGTVTDTATGLMWQQATATGTYTWEEALSYCEGLSLADHNDWRLPNRNELQSLVEYTAYNPSIDTDFFPNTLSSYYWSSTTDIYYTSAAWDFYFYTGVVNYYGKASSLSVRAVRGGQCGSLGDSECDDTNPCTDDSCVAGQCVNQCNAVDSTDSCCDDSACASAPVCAHCSLDMTHFWKLDETGSPTTFYDFYESTNNATCVTNCPTPTTGIIDGAQQFDGIDDEVDVADDGSFDWDAGDSFSIEYWMKKDSVCAGSVWNYNEVIVGRDDSNLHWWVGISCMDSGEAIFVLRDEDRGEDLALALGNTVVTNDEWYHIVAVRDASAGTISIYVNGTEENSVPASFSSGFVSSAALNIGYLNLYNHFRYNGILDGVALWDKALTPGDILSHYNTGLYGADYCELCLTDNDCDDGNPCTDDSCIPGSGCAYDNNTNSCDDGIFCNGSDTCSDGLCVIHSGDPCVGGAECNDSCQEATQTCYSPLSTPCSNDGNDCTDDECGGAGTCIHPNNTDPCNDGIACTDNDVCAGSTCSGTPNSTLCSDGNVCTNDICTVGVGCSNQNNTDSCNDGITCTEDDMCSGGACSGTPNNNLCSDGNVCTNDICTVGVGCSNQNNTDSCNDGITCTEDDMCSGGACGGTPIDCSAAGDQCNDGVCNETNDTCEPQPLVDGTACDDEYTCTDDACVGGQCVGECNATAPEDVCCDDPACASAPVCSNCSPDMTHFWKLDETGSPTTFYDFYEGTNNATCVTNCPTPATGIINGAQQFDGIDDEVNLADDGSFDWSAGDSFSIEYWMKKDSVCAGSVWNYNEVILGRDDSNLHWWVGISCMDSGEAIFVLRDEDRGEDLALALGNTVVTNDEWYHIVAVRDANAGTISIYVNGTEENSVPASFSSGFVSSAALNIGYLNSYNHFRYNGILDGVALWDKALTPGDILSHYNTGLNGADYCELCLTDNDCDDGNPCTDDSCIPGSGCAYDNNTNSCDDGIFCNGSDTCSDGLCAIHSGDPCVGGAECNDSCQEATQTCYSPSSTYCTNDGNDCTDDECDGAGTCIHPNNTDPCNDGIACTDNDVCAGSTCSGTPNSTLCSDGNVCTNDICTVGVGCSNQNNTDSCNDGITCTEDDMCSGGACSGTPNNNLCSDGNVCTNDICTVGVGCSNQNNTDSCNDGITCTEDDVCSGGACSGTPNSTLCSDGNVCTNDICTVGVGCSNQNNTAPCDDNFYCTGNDQCTGGVCGGTPIDCSAAGDQCNVGVCNETTDTCEPQSLADGTSCDDSLYCTVSDQCTGGVCGGTPIDCSAAGDQCNVGVCNETNDTCEPQSLADGISCDDSLYCTVSDQCTSGICGGTPIDCSAAGDQCNVGVCNETTDTCEPQSLADGISCDDENTCTDDACVGGQCVGECNATAPADVCCDDAACASVPVCAHSRVAGEVVLYTFEEGTGITVNDISGAGLPLDLIIADESAINWIPDGGLSIIDPTLIDSGIPATKLIDAIKTSNEITVEAWIIPVDTSQSGPARIVTLSEDTGNRNVTLGQGLWNQPLDLIDVRLRTSATDGNGHPSLSSPSGSLTTGGLKHVVYTRNATGVAKIYINAIEEASGTVGGYCSNWGASYRLALGNELTGDRPWLGEYHLVAVYNKALSQLEVERNYVIGPRLDTCSSDPDCDDTNICTDDSCIAGRCVNQCNAVNSTDSCCDDPACASAPVCPNCSPDMTHYWKLDETGSPTTFYDFYEGTNNATCLTNCPTPTTGIIDGAQQFDGIDDEVNVADDGSFDWGAGDSFSIEYWMKKDSVCAGSVWNYNEVILGRDDSNLHWWVGISCMDSGEAIFVLRDEDRGEDLALALGSTVVTNDEWYHIVAVRNASAGTISIYVNGTEENSVPASFSSGFVSSAALNIGYLNLYNHFRYNGILDEVTFWDKALTPEEILSHYNTGLNGADYCD